MPTSPTISVIERLRRTVLREGAGLGDGELLGRFLECHDEAALAALVRRHGPMVWGVCCRLLGHHDAEDAFQATFLVLVRKAASVVPRELVGNFLYGVACQTALQARRTTGRRRAREVQVTDMPDTEAVQQDQWLDVKPLLDQELSRLPDIYRTVVVLCDLEGRTRKEVARQLGVPEGTVAGRLARARAMLAKRLTQRGVTLSGGALAAVLAEQAVSAGVPPSVVSNTIRAASSIAAGQAAATGPVSVKAAALTEGVLRAMMMSKLKAAIAVVLVLGFIVTGATVLSGRTAARANQPPAAEAPMKTPEKPEKEKEAFTAWGKEVGALQAGLGFRPGENRVYHHGETVTVVVRVRNIGKEAVEFKHIWAFFFENPPTITDADGKRMLMARGSAEGRHMPRSPNVAPGKEVELFEWKFDLLPQGESSNRIYPLLGPQTLVSSSIHGTGKFSLQCERIVGPTSANPQDPNPAMNKLATGKLVLEVKEAKKPPEKPDQEKEAVTAWGKEIGGLQAGLGFRPGERRVYRIGETITFVVRVRNVGKKNVKIESLNEFFYENAPSITDGDGKPISLEQPIEFSGIPAALMQENLAPGKEAVLCELDLQIRPASEKGKGRPWRWTLYETGKFQVQFEKVGGNIGKVGAGIGTGEIRFDPILSKLATGKLEIEVKEPEKIPPEKEAFTAWGKEVGGLQAGLGFRPGEKRAYRQGEEAWIVLRVRNVGKEGVEFKHIWAFFVENPPTIADAEGKPVRMPGPAAEGLQGAHTTTVAPGKEVALYEWNIHLLPKGATSKNLLTIRETGKFSLQRERVVGPTSGNPNHPNPALDKLATGKLELEVKEAEKLPEKKEKEGFTAWGKVGRGLHKGNEVDGLQVGLGFRPGEKRAYSHGETVTLVVRVRNVGKEEFTFDYIPGYFVDWPPSVTDGEGKAGPQVRVAGKGGTTTRCK